nr:hypothetical protein Q903MT_gene1070 [Picea sitchensis]
MTPMPLPLLMYLPVSLPVPTLRTFGSSGILLHILACSYFFYIPRFIVCSYFTVHANVFRVSVYSSVFRVFAHPIDENQAR